MMPGGMLSGGSRDLEQSGPGGLVDLSNSKLDFRKSRTLSHDVVHFGRQDVLPPKWFALQPFTNPFEAHLVYLPLVVLPVSLFGSMAWDYAAEWRATLAGRELAESEKLAFARAVVYIADMTVGLCVTVCYHVLLRVTSPIDGSLVHLGVATRMIRRNDLEVLHRWLKALSGLQVVFVFYGSWLAVSVIAESFGELADAPICTSGALDKTGPVAELCRKDPRLIAAAPWIPIVSACFLAWFMTLQVAALLAKRAVSDLRLKVQTIGMQRNISDSEWRMYIRDPAVDLARYTMPALAAWGPSVGAAVVAGLASAVGNIPLVRQQHTLAAVNICLSILVPLLVASIPAAVSTECDLLMLDLNEARGSASDATTHERVLELETYLGNTNGGTRFGQGVGFLVFGIRLDRRVLKTMAICLYAVIIPFLVFLLTTSPETAVKLCNITAAVTRDELVMVIQQCDQSIRIGEIIGD